MKTIALAAVLSVGMLGFFANNAQAQRYYRGGYGGGYHGGYRPYYGGYHAYRPYYGGYYNSYRPYYGGYYNYRPYYYGQYNPYYGGGIYYSRPGFYIGYGW